jgi:hypothetical protein
MYAELTYFDGAHFKHIADYHEHLRVKRLHKQACQAMQRGSRGSSAR